MADYSIETQFILQGHDLVIGIDEVGRGSFAGPVIAAGVVFNPKNVPFRLGITDSKLLNRAKRNELNTIILSTALWYYISLIEIDVINRIGILKATEIAFNNVLQEFSKSAHFVKPFCLIDGSKPNSSENVEQIPQKRIVRGDQKSISIAAASIIAKVYRDDFMEKLHNQYPNYLFIKNKGYGTLEHRNAIKKFGLSVVHRTSFNLTKFL